jgi:hypothetical protein
MATKKAAALATEPKKRKTRVVTKEVVLSAEQFLSGVNRITNALEKIEQLDIQPRHSHALLEQPEFATVQGLPPSRAVEKATIAPVADLIRVALSRSSDIARLSFDLSDAVRNGSFTPQKEVGGESIKDLPDHGVLKDDLVGVLNNLNMIESRLHSIANYIVE